LFSFERKENNNHKPYGYKKILWEHLHLITLLCLLLSTRAYIFFFSAFSAEKRKNLLLPGRRPYGPEAANPARH
jgi:hypothetical protein